MKPFRALAALALITPLIACGAGRDSAEQPAAAEQKVATAEAPQEVATITVDALRDQLQSAESKPLLVDVREPNEFEAAHIAEARLAPLGNVEKDLSNVEKDREIVLICRTGNRSGKAYRRLAAQGYTNMRNVEGGMQAWEKKGYPVVASK